MRTIIFFIALLFEMQLCIAQSSDTVFFSEKIIFSELYGKQELHEIESINTKENDSCIIYQYRYNNFTLDYYMLIRDSEYFIEDEIRRNDFLYFKKQRIVLDSLYGMYWENANFMDEYAQSTDIVKIIYYKFGGKKYLSILAVDLFIYGVAQKVNFFNFQIDTSNQLKFIGVSINNLDNSNYIGDYNKDGYLDFFTWDGESDIGKIETLIEGELSISKELYLKFVYPPEKNYVPHIVLSQSKFPPLDKMRK